MAGTNSSFKESAPLDFSVPEGGPSPNMHALSEQNGLGSLKLNDVQSTAAKTNEQNVKQIDLGQPIEPIWNPRVVQEEPLPSDKTAFTKSTDVPKPTDISKSPDGPKPTDAKDAPKSNERGETSIDLKFDSYDLPDGGKLLVGKSDFQKTPFQPILLDKDGKFVESNGGGGSGGVGPNGEKLPATRSNDYVNGASDSYSEGDNKYNYTDKDGKTHTIELKDKIEFGKRDEAESNQEQENEPKVTLDPNKPVDQQLKEIMSYGGHEANVKVEQYELPNGEKLVTWDLNGKPNRTFVMDKNGTLDFVQGGGGGGGGGPVDPTKPAAPKSNNHGFSNGAEGSWNEGSNSYTYTDKSGNQTVIQLRKPME